MSTFDRSDLVDRILSVSAIVAALAAVAVAVYEARIDRQHQKHSVWPYLYQYNSGADGRYRRLVQNVGLGPAQVRSFQIRVDGEVKHTWGEVIRSVTGVEVRPDYVYSSLGRGSVLLPGEPLELLVMARDSLGAAVHANIARASIRICYCSLYGDCWLSDSQAAEPAPVAACPAETEAEFSE